MRFLKLKVGAAVMAMVATAGMQAGAQQAAAAPATPPAASSAHGSGLDDGTIAAIFDAANSWDIETGALAARKGSTKEIRDFGHMLVRDHTAVRAQGRALVAKDHLKGSAPKGFALAKDHAEAMARLRAAKGAAFDRAFLEHEVAYHKAVLDAVQQTLLPSTTAPELKDLETKVAPAFQAHMMAAQNLLDRHGK